MAKNLVIVESPAKAKTLTKYLGQDFEVLASYGHVRDLVPKDGAVDTSDFSMKYEPIDRNKKHVDAIAKALKKNDALYLATDPDREGEAISWHLQELLKEKKALNNKPVHRVVFHEVTKSAIKDAISHPRTLSMELINAQQARRALDYLVGFNLSPLLWRKIKRGLSAGRVQSPALRLIVEREKEIEAFVAREYWSIEADLKKEKHAFLAKLIQYKKEKVEQFTVEKEPQATKIREALLAEANGRLKVAEVKQKKRKRYPAPPFTTSTLQQEASRKLRFSAQKTMRVAQQLYEGIEVGSESDGLITYMRTDSVILAKQAVQEIRDAIASHYGKDKVPAKAYAYKTKSKNAQEAHEAIRPTSARRLPRDVKNYLTADQFKLYDLIWKRAVACQMIPATINTMTVDLACGEGNLFRATGSSIVEPGFILVYQEGRDDAPAGNGDEKMLPNLQTGELIDLLGIRSEQHFTKPPARFTEASLVKTLEEYGIGRPSTYASIIATLLNREYAELEQRSFKPTDIGRIVNRFLTEHFDTYVDYDFTARLEDDLDAVSRGERDWKPLMKEFWEPFSARLDEKAEVPREEVLQARELGVDPKSGRPVSARMARYGPVVQIGTRDDEEKPQFASLLPGQSLEKITFEEAMELFKLPRHLGETPEGEAVAASIGRYGPYIRYGKKFVSLKDDSPYNISLERAIEIITEKKTADANRVIQVFDGTDIQILNGRYGPYITNGKKNVKIPKGKEPKELTREECEKLIAAAPERKARGRRKTTKRKA